MWACTAGSAQVVCLSLEMEGSEDWDGGPASALGAAIRVLCSVALEGPTSSPGRQECCYWPGEGAVLLQYLLLLQLLESNSYPVFSTLVTSEGCGDG